MKILDCFILYCHFCFFFFFNFAFVCFALLCREFVRLKIRMRISCHAYSFIRCVWMWMQTFYHFISFVRSFVHSVWLRSYTPFHFVIFAVCFTLFSLFLFLPLVSRIVIKFQKLNRIVRFSLCSRVGIRVSVYASAFWLVVPQHSMRECG